MVERLCVFCGERPASKTNEHILPQWLIALTGEPNRTVKFGVNYENGKIIEFSWSGLVVPACKTCNGNYGKSLEDKAKAIVEALLARRAIPANEFLILLDWLDKVRIGLWLNYQMIQKIPSGVTPNFRISQRLGTKDRMVAVYTLDTPEKGLNAFGVETYVFHMMPTCFGVKINNILLFNMSADFLFSGNCGFPTPKEMFLHIDGANKGMTQIGDFSTSRSVADRLMLPRLVKSTIQLYQPIMQLAPVGTPWRRFMGAEWDYDSFVSPRLLNSESGQGILFRQFDDHVEEITDLDNLVELDQVDGKDSVPLWKLIQQVYEFQIVLWDKVERRGSSPEVTNAGAIRSKEIVEENHEIIRFYQSLQRK